MILKWRVFRCFWDTLPICALRAREERTHLPVLLPHRVIRGMQRYPSLESPLRLREYDAILSSSGLFVCFHPLLLVLKSNGKLSEGDAFGKTGRAAGFCGNQWAVFRMSWTICVSASLIGVTGLPSSFSKSLLSTSKEPSRMPRWMSTRNDTSGSGRPAFFMMSA